MPTTNSPQTDKPVQAVKNRSRRSLLTRLWVIIGGLALVEITWAVFSFLKPRKPLNNPDNQSEIVDAGPVDRFTANTVTAYPQGRFYLSCLADGGFLALSRRCTHLGCTVPWNDEKKQFVCPCHASVFNRRGEVIHAPAPRPLDRFFVSIENNRVKVDIEKPIRRSAFTKEDVVYNNEAKGPKMPGIEGNS